jgi:UPF0755 protein
MKKHFSLLFPLIAGLLSIAAVFGLPFGLFLLQPMLPSHPAVVTIAPGTSFSRIADRLESENNISSAFNLKILALLRGDARNVQAGQYNFAAASRPGRVLDRLTAGDVRRLRLTLPEGLTMVQIAERLRQAGYQDHETFLQLARDPAFIQQLGIDAATLEGYLFPNTYSFGARLPARHLLRFMVSLCFERLSPELLTQADKLGLNRHALITLASIIQRETARRSEMPIIAAVFHNRLRRGMPLQADPTVIYGLAHFNGNLTRRDLRTPTPYNTYTRRGLPAGPIANPGGAALHAAAHPAEVDYLYFVSRGNGRHQFSHTLREHNRAVRRYQLRRVARAEDRRPATDENDADPAVKKAPATASEPPAAAPPTTEIPAADNG